MNNNKKIEKKSKKNNNTLNKLKEIFNKIKKVVNKFLKSNWDILLMNLIIFVLTVFIESLYFNDLNIFIRIDTSNLIKLLNMILFIIIPTVIFTLKRKIDVKKILISIPTLYLLFLIFIDYCTLREIYGINSLGVNDIPNYVDAIMVVFIFTMIEYITSAITNKIKFRKDSKKIIKCK